MPASRFGERTYGKLEKDMMALYLLLGGAMLFLWGRFYRGCWLRNLFVKVSFEKDFVYCGEQVQMTEVIENRKRIPLPVVEIGFRIQKGVRFVDVENTTVSDFIYKRDVFSVLGWESITRKYQVECEKRGHYRITQQVLETHSLFFRREYRLEEDTDTELYVYAGKRDISRIMKSCESILGDVISRNKVYEDPFAFASIREYTPLDPMKTINWKASARTGNLMVNTFSSVCSRQFMIYLDVWDRGILKADELVEEGIAVAASLLRSLVRQGLETGLCVNAGDSGAERRGITLFPPEKGQSHLSGIERFLTENFDRLEKTSFEDMVKEVPADRIPVFITREYHEELENLLRDCLPREFPGIQVVICGKENKTAPRQEGMLKILPWRTV